jgi:iron complex outermembrane receptor protein
VFGQASTGGAINVISRKPRIGEFSGNGAVSYGNYNYVKADGGVNLPISDRMAVRLSARYFRHDGYAKATQVNGGDYELDDADNFGARAALLWEATDGLTVELAGQTFDADHGGAAQKNILDPDPDPRRLTQDFPSTFKLQNRMAYLTLSQELGQSAMLKSVSAYQYIDKHQTQDNDRLATDFYDNHVHWRDRSKTFTQELSLSSVGDSRFEWTVGAFYLRQRALQDILELSSVPALEYNGLPVKYQTYSPYQHTSIAGYAQGSYRVTDAFKLTAGGRYSWDKTTGQPSNYYDLFGAVAPRKTTSDLFTGKLGVEYQASPDHMVYATASRGYKPSGVNFNGGAVLVPSLFQKETVYAAEVGTKSTFADRRIRLNVAGYYYWYKQFQFVAEDPVPNAGGVDNIPRADVYGVEFETTVLPFDGLRFDGTLSLSKGKFKSNFSTIDPVAAQGYRTAAEAAGLYYDYNPTSAASMAYFDYVRSRGLVNIDGNNVPKLPGVQGNASATYTHALAGGEASLRVEMIYRSSFDYRIFNTPQDKVPAYTLFNLFVRYQPDKSPLTFSFSANNLFNKDGINSLFSDPYGTHTTSAEYIAPRQVFGTVSFAF